MHLDTLLYTEPEVFLRLLLLENFWMTFERKLFCPLTQRTIIIFLFRIKEFGQKFSYFTHCHHEKIKRKTFRVLWHVISIQTNLICRHVPPISSKLSSDNKIWASRIFPSTEKSHNLAIRTPQIRPQVLSYAKDRQWAGSSETVGTSLTIWNINLQRLLWFYFIIFLSRCW